MSDVRLVEICKHYDGVARPAVRDLNLVIPSGELVVLVGPSGCGKSTTLRIIAGLEEPTGGRVFIGERDVTTVAPAQRDIAMVFQNYALYPHMTVLENMAFGLRQRKLPNADILSRVEDAARILNITELLQRKPRQLSGGQRQRVAMGRAIVRDPQVFLFDEPLSNLDAKLRVAMRTEIKELHQRLKTTTVYVTHDQIEAMTMADKIVVMHDGRVEQMGEPLALYDRPANRFVAGFIGSPAMNFLEGAVHGADGRRFVKTASGARLPVAEAGAAAEGQPVIYGIRPEHLELADDGFDAEVIVIEPTGSETQLFARLGGQEIVAVFRERHDFAPGQKIRLRPRPDMAHLFDPSSGQRI